MLARPLLRWRVSVHDGCLAREEHMRRLGDSSRSKDSLQYAVTHWHTHNCKVERQHTTIALQHSVITTSKWKLLPLRVLIVVTQNIDVEFLSFPPQDSSSRTLNFGLSDVSRLITCDNIERLRKVIALMIVVLTEQNLEIIWNNRIEVTTQPTLQQQ